jgi:hypothetical protein
MPIRAFSPQMYDSLCSKLKELSALNGISGVLQWDEMVSAAPNLMSFNRLLCRTADVTVLPCGEHPHSTPGSRFLSTITRSRFIQVMMPPGASECRGAQKAALAGVMYDKVGPGAVKVIVRSCMACSALPEPGHHQGACQKHVALPTTTSQHTALHSALTSPGCGSKGAFYFSQPDPLASGCFIAYTTSTISDSTLPDYLSACALHPDSEPPPCLSHATLPACLPAEDGPRAGRAAAAAARSQQDTGAGACSSGA